MRQAPYQPATNYWRAVELQEIVQYNLPNGRGIDLGCGDGHVMAILMNHIGKRDIVGIDVDVCETAIAARRSVYQGLLTASADHLPLEDNSFDFAFSNSVLEHIKNIDAVLHEVARVLRVGGSFIFTVPSADFPACLRGPFFGNRDEYLSEVDARCAHLRYWSSSEWAQHLSIAGLSLTHEHSYLGKSQLQRWEDIARLTSGILYTSMKRRKQPIEIQRQFGIRSSRIRIPRLLAASVGRIMNVAVGSNTDRFACLLVEAVKNR